MALDRLNGQISDVGLADYAVDQYNISKLNESYLCVSLKEKFVATIGKPINLDVLDRGWMPTDSVQSPCMAMIVCHGMGQQVPFETLDELASAISEEHTLKNGDDTVEVILRFVLPTGSEKPLPRAEITLKQLGKPNKTVHLYEAYWAPLTEGAISYRQTALKIMKAGFNGLKEGFKQKFSRWMFGGNKDLPIDHGTGRLLIVLLAIITPVLLIPTLIGFGLKSVIVGYMIDSKDIILFIILLIVLTYISYKIQYFIIQYMGDVIIYVSSNEVNSFWKIRDDIKQIGLNLAKIVYGAVNNDHTHLSKKLKNKFDPHFLYSKITIVGHSLGSVIAYDTLNAIINQDKLDSGARNVVERTEALITFGSPMDKVAFLFRQMAKDALAREMLAAAHQPMILSYENRPKWWINIFCKVDIISGSLEYFDDPKSTVQQQRSVRNYRDLYNNWLRPVNAHTGYWKRSPTKKILYLAATSSLDTLDENSFRYVKIRKI